MYKPPMMGFEDWAANPSVDVQWKDGARVAAVGILGTAEIVAREQAEHERREELRSHDNVVLLEDWEAIEGQEADLC